MQYLYILCVLYTTLMNDSSIFVKESVKNFYKDILVHTQERVLLKKTVTPKDFKVVSQRVNNIESSGDKKRYKP